MALQVNLNSKFLYSSLILYNAELWLIIYAISPTCKKDLGNLQHQNTYLQYFEHQNTYDKI